MKWVHALADIKSDELYSISRIQRSCGVKEVTGPAIRNHIRRTLQRQKLDPSYDGKDTLGLDAWWGWKIRLCIPSKVIPYEVWEQFQKEGQKRLTQLDNEDCHPEPENHTSNSDRIRKLLKLKTFVLIALSLLVGSAFAINWQTSEKQIWWHELKGDIEWLRSSLNIPKYKSYRSRIIQSIAKVNLKNGDPFFSVELAEHYATFAYEKNPFIWYDERILLLGSLASFEGDSGYVSGIFPGYFELRTDMGTQKVNIPRTFVMGKIESWPYVVSISSNDGAGLLNVLAEVNGWEENPSFPNIVIHGNWMDVRNATDFVSMISSEAGVSINGKRYEFHDAPRVAIGWGRLRPWRTKLSSLAEKYEELGVSLTYPQRHKDEYFLFGVSSLDDLKASLATIGEERARE